MVQTRPQERGELSFSRSFNVSRERLFRAWTNPDEVKKWWVLGQGWNLTIAEINLKVGGRFRIGLQSAQHDGKHSVTGTFREVLIPEKLVYTWSVENSSAIREESLVTVEFHERGKDSSELVLKHERIQSGEGQSTRAGWSVLFEELQNLLNR